MLLSYGEPASVREEYRQAPSDSTRERSSILGGWDCWGMAAPAAVVEKEGLLCGQVQAYDSCAPDGRQHQHQHHVAVEIEIQTDTSRMGNGRWQ